MTTVYVLASVQDVLESNNNSDPPHISSEIAFFKNVSAWGF